MEHKSTTQLMKILNQVDNDSKIEEYLSELDSSDMPTTFPSYMEKIMEEKHIDKSDLINNSQIERTYGYQILNGRKNAGRNKIIAMCLAAKLNIKETQRALEIAHEGVLYSRDKRDAVIIFAVNHKYNVIKTNQLLKEYNFEEL